MPLLQLLTEDFNAAAVDKGVLTLYHYSTVDKEEFILDPKKFGEKPFTRAEKKVSDYPRVFFYLDPEDKELFYRSSAYNLYTVDVPRNEVYNLKQDPISIIKSIRNKEDGALKFDNLFALIINNGYNGIYYRVKNRDVVIWFDPIKVYRIKR